MAHLAGYLSYERSNGCVEARIRESLFSPPILANDPRQARYPSRISSRRCGGHVTRCRDEFRCCLSLLAQCFMFRCGSEELLFLPRTFVIARSGARRLIAIETQERDGERKIERQRETERKGERERRCERVLLIPATRRIFIVIREDRFELLSKFCFNLSLSLSLSFSSPF